MNYTIILGFFAIIVAVSAMPQSGNQGVRRVRFPQRWADAAVQCIGNIPTEVYHNYLAGNVNLASAAARLVALCYYSEAGMFVDGRFDTAQIENFLRDHIIHHELLDELLDVFKRAADAGNSAEGDFSVKAFAFHAVLVLPETKRLFSSIFRPFRNSK